MKKIKVSEATNIQLDWLVVKCEGSSELEIYDGCGGGDRAKPRKYVATIGGFTLNYTTSPAQMWPIIEREMFDVLYMGDGYRHYWRAEAIGGYVFAEGITSLIAAARCYIISKLGEEVEVPKELT